jgi:hypothetical protein
LRESSFERTYTRPQIITPCSTHYERAEKIFRELHVAIDRSERENLKSPPVIPLTRLRERSD